MGNGTRAMWRPTTLIENTIAKIGWKIMKRSKPPSRRGPVVVVVKKAPKLISGRRPVTKPPPADMSRIGPGAK